MIREDFFEVEWISYVATLYLFTDDMPAILFVI